MKRKAKEEKIKQVLTCAVCGEPIEIVLVNGRRVYKKVTPDKKTTFNNSIHEKLPST